MDCIDNTIKKSMPHIIYIGTCVTYYESNKWTEDTPNCDMVDFFMQNILHEHITYALKRAKKRTYSNCNVEISQDDVDDTRRIELRCECAHDNNKCQKILIRLLKNVTIDLMKIWIDDLNSMLFKPIDTVMQDVLVGDDNNGSASSTMNRAIEFLASKIISGTKAEHPILIEGQIIRADDDKPDKPDKPDISKPGSYKIISGINVSRTSTVVRALSLTDHKIYAIKISTDEPNTKLAIDYEVSILRRLHSNLNPNNNPAIEIPAIIDLFSIYVYGGVHSCIVMKLYGMDLYEYLAERRTDTDVSNENKKPSYSKGLSIEEIRHIVYQIVICLRHMHFSNVIHNDIKLENIVLRDPNRANLDVVLIDYGLSIAMPSDSSKSREIRGTVAYLSPEELSGFDHSTKSDIWSLGIVLLELLTGTEIMTGEIIENMVSIENITGYVFKSIHKDIGITLFQYKLEKSRLNKYVSNSVGTLYDRNYLQNAVDDIDFRDFIERCLNPDPNNRASADELYRHGFLDSIRSV